VGKEKVNQMPVVRYGKIAGRKVPVLHFTSKKDARKFGKNVAYSAGVIGLGASNAGLMLSAQTGSWREWPLSQLICL
jgi:hypothetical protein